MDVIQGADFAIRTTLADASNNAIDLTTGVARFMLKAKVADPDSKALVTFDSTGSPGLFDFSEAAAGAVVTRVAGNLTAALDIKDKLKVFAQVEVKVTSGQDSFFYRSPTVEFNLVESVIGS